jgi:hypothetical protein
MKRLVMILLVMCGAAIAQEMVTTVSYVFDYTYPQPSVQGIVGEKGRPIRASIQVVDGVATPYDLTNKTLVASIIQGGDLRTNATASVSVEDGTNGQYLVRWTPTLSGTAQLIVDAYDESSGLYEALIGKHDVSIAEPATVVTSTATGIGTIYVDYTTGGIVSNVAEGTENSWDAGTGELVINTNPVSGGGSGIVSSVVEGVDNSWDSGTGALIINTNPEAYTESEWATNTAQGIIDAVPAGTTNASEIGVALTPTNATFATPDVEAALVGIDTALGSVGGGGSVFTSIGSYSITGGEKTITFTFDPMRYVEVLVRGWVVTNNSQFPAPSAIINGVSTGYTSRGMYVSAVSTDYRALLDPATTEVNGSGYTYYGSNNFVFANNYSRSDRSGFTDGSGIHWRQRYYNTGSKIIARSEISIKATDGNNYLWRTSGIWPWGASDADLLLFTQITFFVTAPMWGELVGASATNNYPNSSIILWGIEE